MTVRRLTFALALVACGAPPPPVGPSADCAAVSALAAMDPRAPVPLQPMMAWHQKQNMMEHLVVIQRVTDGLARDDWAAIAEVSARLGSSSTTQRTCEHMGAGAPGFTERGLELHRRADAIGAAARAQDRAGVLRAMADTLEACTGCHAAYRQQLVDAPPGSGFDPAMMHEGR